MNRRNFLKVGAGTAATLSTPRWAWAFYQTSTTIPLFSTPLRSVGPGGIPVAAPDPFAAPVTGATHYTIDIQQFQDPGVCRSLGSTTLWGYNPTRPLGGGLQPQRHLGGLLVGTRGTPIQITFRNKLNVPKHILPNDTTIMGANLGFNRTAVHLHGGLVPWISDGGPHSWFGPQGNTGPSFLNNSVLNPTAGLGEAEYYYPLNQRPLPLVSRPRHRHHPPERLRRDRLRAPAPRLF
jgi:spore coat protein A, manganese oxidase